MKSCDTSTDAFKKKCTDALKEMKAKESGKDASQITDDEVRKDINDAMGSQIGETMAACMGEANNDRDKAKACRDTTRDAIKDADFDGKAPDEAKLELVLEEAG